MNLERIKQVATRASYSAGEVLKRHFGRLDKVEKKGAIDLVTAADFESEKTIVNEIQSVFPDHAILAEESGLHKGHPDKCWIIDPLDGTTNFAHNLPIFSISIAFSLDQEIQIGIVFNPISGELFTAMRGHGAQLNHHPISVSSASNLEESLLVTGFPYNLHLTISDLMQRFQRTLCACQGIRRLGSAALDLCYVACGRFDGFWEENLNPWDTAAGVLIAQEAGGRVSDFGGSPFDPEGEQILATNGHIHPEMMALLKLKEIE
ncbi:MAG: inositol monophosphatase family protein [Desulfobacteraceae bacterium]